jgi:hypothetical protein
MRTPASRSARPSVQRERCTSSGKDGTCGSDTRQLPVDLDWTADRPVIETFAYVRQNDADCEIDLTVNERTRRARVRGTIGAGDVRMSGGIARLDLQQTQVCT